MPIATSRVTIEVRDPIPDVREREQVLTEAIFRVLKDATLVDAPVADWEQGRFVLLVATQATRVPRVQGTVCVTYEPVGIRAA